MKKRKLFYGRASTNKQELSAELQLNEQEEQVLMAVDTEPTPIDQVVDKSNLPIHRVLSTVSVLEMRKLIRRVSGQLVVRI